MEERVMGWREIVNTDGTPVDARMGETVKQMYGMIWWLAIELAGANSPCRVIERDDILPLIRNAYNDWPLGFSQGLGHEHTSQDYPNQAATFNGSESDKPKDVTAVRPKNMQERMNANPYYRASNILAQQGYDEIEINKILVAFAIDELFKNEVT
jgi:hypothetical protein